MTHMNAKRPKIGHLVVIIIINGPNGSDTSMNINFGPLLPFSVQNITSNFTNLLSCALFALFVFRYFFGPTWLTDHREADGSRSKWFVESPSAGRCRPCPTLRFRPSVALDGRRRRGVAWSTTADRMSPSPAISTLLLVVFPLAWRALRCVTRVRRSVKKNDCYGNHVFYFRSKISTC